MFTEPESFLPYLTDTFFVIFATFPQPSVYQTFAGEFPSEWTLCVNTADLNCCSNLRLLLWLLIVASDFCLLLCHKMYILSVH